MPNTARIIYQKRKDFRVYRVQEDNKVYVVKQVIHHHNGVCTHKCALLKQEFAISQKLKDQNKCIQQYSHHENSVFKFKNSCYLIMEYAEQQDCYDFMVKNLDSLQKPKNMKGLMKSLAEPLQYLHSKNIAHNDVKLDNYYVENVDFEKEQYNIKIADFEYSFEGDRDVEQQIDSLKNRNNAVLSIDQRQVSQERQQYDERQSDIYCFGMMLFELYFQISSNNLMQYQCLQRWIDSGDIQAFKSQFPKLMSMLKQNQSEEDIDLFMKLIFSCLNSDPSKRNSLEELIQQLD